MKTCRHFKGDRPCKYYWIDRSWNCPICEHHNPFNERILLIKLDASTNVSCVPVSSQKTESNF